MEFRTLLRAEGLALNEVTVFLHVPNVPVLRRALPQLVEEDPALFDAFQNQHGPRVEATLKARPYIASFVALPGGDFLFAGLFRITGHRFHTMAELDAVPARQELRLRYGDICFVELGKEKGLTGRLVFDLQAAPELASLTGRLSVSKPVNSGQSYRFLAENFAGQVMEISLERRFVPPPPDWRDMVLSATELRTLPRDWAARLKEWRGVYLVVDQSDGARYVGSAYGAENLHARWQAHVRRDKGVTAELSKRDPAGFRFSILERTSPDLPADEVIAIEQNWKSRLDTVAHGLNRN